MKPTMSSRNDQHNHHAAKKAKVESSKAMFDWGDDEDIQSGEDSEDSENPDNTSSEDEESLKESAHDKRIRLAKEYLGKLHEEHDDEKEEASPSGVVGEDPIAARLALEAKEAAGKLFHNVADKINEFEFDEDSSRFYRGHKLSTTALALCGSVAYTASKDGSILRWTIPEGKKTKLVFPSDDEVLQKSESQRAILALATSSNGEFLVSAGRDKLVRVWDTSSNSLAESFSGHRDAVSCLTFRKNSLMLFSGSYDRTIKHWNLKEMGYVETLFGHQNEINGISSLRAERVASCGADSSVRLWKIPEETQLVFHGNQGSSIDTITMVNEQYYVTGADDGSLVLWFSGRKKPVYTVPKAHGPSNWISSTAMLDDSDLLATGSCDGYIRLWKVDLQGRQIVPVGAIPASGFVNALAFCKKGEFIVAGLGQEHRLGRWRRIAAAKNGILVTALPELSI